MAKLGRRMLRSKKGSVLDLILIAVFMLSFALAILIGFKVTTEFNTVIQANADIPTEGKTASTALLGEFTSTMDYGFLFFAMGLSIVVLLMAALVRVHPIFIVIYIIGLLLVIFISGIISNVYHEIADSTELVTLSNQLLFVDKIMTFLPWFVAIVGTLLCIIMYKSYSDGIE